MEDASLPPTRQTVFDYDRTVVAFHGTRIETARKLVAGTPFGISENDDDWLGHGIYFWEYAPQQAWWWSKKRFGDQAAVVGALVRLGRCIDLLDPSNSQLLREAHRGLEGVLAAKGEPLPSNVNAHKRLDCAVFNYLYEKLQESGYAVESVRSVFVPSAKRLWSRSGVFQDSHIQLVVREPRNILAVWSVRKDGRYGQDS